MNERFRKNGFAKIQHLEIPTGIPAGFFLKKASDSIDIFCTFAVWHKRYIYVFFLRGLKKNKKKR